MRQDDDEPKAKDLTSEDLLAAYQKMPDNERAHIDEQADCMILGMKRKNPRVAFGKLQALELLAKFGIWEKGRAYRP